jgi:hypothetical protein
MTKADLNERILIGKRKSNMIALGVVFDNVGVCVPSLIPIFSSGLIADIGDQDIEQRDDNRSPALVATVFGMPPRKR